jgi:integrase
MTTATPLAPTREQLFEALAALRAAGDTFDVLSEPDSAAGEFFKEVAHRLQDEFFGKEHVENDEWMRDPIEVELQARSAEIEAEALAQVQQFQALGERIRTLRTMAPRYRELGTIDVQFSPIVRCVSLGRSTSRAPWDGGRCGVRMSAGSTRPFSSVRRARRRPAMPSGACVLRYEGTRGTVWRVKYRDAEGCQVQETIGREADGVTRKQAEAELRERLVRVERKGYRRPRTLTFGDYAETWFEAGKRSQGWKPATVTAYRNAIDAYLVPAFGSTRLDAIRPRDVSAFVTDAMTRAQGKNKRPLSGKYVNWLLNLAFSIFKGAVGEELIESNPVASVQRPKVERKRWRILEPVEVPRVHKAFSDDRARRVFLTLTLTGLRRSEVVGLRWRHVNLVEGTLRVEESKSEEGDRLIALPRTLIDLLAEQFTSSPFRTDDDYVFAHPKRGSKLEAKWYHDRFQQALATAGVEGHVRCFHDMRHTALTNLAATGASPIAIMTTAGHRSMATTRGYLHLAGVVFHDEASALGRRLLGVQDSGTKSPAPAPLSGNA